MRGQHHLLRWLSAAATLAALIGCNYPGATDPCSPEFLIRAIAQANAANATTPTTIRLRPASVCVYTFVAADHVHPPAEGGAGYALPTVRVPIVIDGACRAPDPCESDDPRARLVRAGGASTPQFGFFEITEGGSLTLIGVRLANSHYEAILVDRARLTLRNSQIEGTHFGSGVRNFHGSVTVEGDSTFLNNTAAQGAGVFNTNGTLIIRDSVFEGNEVVSSWGGGAIYAAGDASGGRVHIENTLFENNRTTYITYDDIPGGGGAIALSGGEMAIYTSEFRGNQALTHHGGAVWLDFGRLEIHDSTFDRNVARHGGAILNYGADLRIYDSTFSENRAEFQAPRAIYTSGGAIHADGQTLIVNSTFSGNVAGYGAGVSGSGFLTILFSTFADNVHLDPQGGTLDYSPLHSTLGPVFNQLEIGNTLFTHSETRNCAINGGGYEIVARGANLSSDDTCPHATMITEALIGPLQYNGGATLTRGLLEGSPAIDAATGACQPADQTGYTRPEGTTCDVGAYEYRVLRLELDPPLLTPVPPLPIGTAPLVPVVATIRHDTLCWQGPGPQYEVVSSLLQGTQVQVRGIGEPPDWLIVDNPRYPGVDCWANEEALVIAPGLDLSSLQHYSAPPAPTATAGSTPTAPAAPPAAPAGLSIEKRTCSDLTYSLTLVWQDTASNEFGYRVSRHGALLATLEANATLYTDAPPYGGPYTYEVEAFNAAGPSTPAGVLEAGCLY